METEITTPKPGLCEVNSTVSIFHDIMLNCTTDTQPVKRKPPPPERDFAVIVKNLCMSYDKGGPLILNDLSLTVKKGTIYGLLGSSGCGKTTALSCIVGQKGWDSGEIYAFDKWWDKESTIPGKRLGFVPQDIALYNHLSIKENIQYYGRLYGMGEYEILQRWQFLVKLLQLPTDFNKVLNLSGGQRRRTSLALALVHSPELLILDEPTVGLDPLLRESVWKHLYKLVENQGTTIIITTHYIEEMKHATNVGVMRHGRLLVEGSPSVLLAQHKAQLLEDVILKLCRKVAQAQNLNNNINNTIKNDGCQKRIVSAIRNSQITFQSKRKSEELDGIIVSKNISGVGKYKKYPGFDPSPPLPVLQNEGKKHISNTSNNYLIGAYAESLVKIWVSSLLGATQRTLAYCCVMFLSLVRHPVFFIAALILPALEILLTVSTVGKLPANLRMGVVNEELPEWNTLCYFDNMANVENTNGIHENLTECDITDMSCKYLKTVSGDNFLILVPYNSTDEAEAGVRMGDIRGFLHFFPNYTQHMIDRMAARSFAFEESLNGSTVKLRLDMSEYLTSLIITQQLYEGLQRFFKELIHDCRLGSPELADIPLKYRKPVYGTVSNDYHHFIIPSILANIIFIMPFTVSSLTFITDLKAGTIGRAKVAGLQTSELLMTYAITQGAIVIGQILICTMCLTLGFDFQIQGSTLQYIVITFLLGMCGQTFGVWIGIICKDEIECLITAVFILPTLLLFGGALWPSEALKTPFKEFSLALPTTLITDSLRSTATRAVGLTHALMWPGIVITTAWLVFFWIVIVLTYRMYFK